MMDEGLKDVKVHGCEILPADGVEWCEAPESATQSWVVGGGVSTRVLKEFASDCWSQPEPIQGDQLVGTGHAAAVRVCIPELGAAIRAYVRWKPPGSGSGYMAMCPCHGLT
jgi:hypothetical protein